MKKGVESPRISPRIMICTSPLGSHLSLVVVGIKRNCINASVFFRLLWFLVFFVVICHDTSDGDGLFLVF